MINIESTRKDAKIITSIRANFNDREQRIIDEFADEGYIILMPLSYQGANVATHEQFMAIDHMINESMNISDFTLFFNDGTTKYEHEKLLYCIDHAIPYKLL